MFCNIIRVEQGSEEWLDARRGRITASRLGDVMAKPGTKRHEDYKQQIINELLGYQPTETDRPEWFEHGKAMEPKAIGAIQFQEDIEGEHDLMCIHPEYNWLSCSPDLLLLEDDKIIDAWEIKCRAMLKTYNKYIGKMAEKVENGFATWIPPENRHQVQGQMWVMGLPTLKYSNYHEWLEQGVRKLRTFKVRRDQDLIDKMEIRCMEFMRECYIEADMGAAA